MKNVKTEKRAISPQKIEIQKKKNFALRKSILDPSVQISAFYVKQCKLYRNKETDNN